jgi:hypothetical protein
MGENSWKRE